MDKENRFEKISRVSSKSNASYATEVTEDVTIKGNIPVTFKAALEKGEGHNFQMYGVLMDVSDKEFDAVVDGSANDTGVQGAFWQGGTLQNLDVKNFKTASTKQKVIAKGWINLASPNSKYESSSSRDYIEPKVGEFHEYTMYLQPNVYKVEKGHRLVLVLNPYDLSDLSIEKEYQIRLQTESIQAVLPVVEKDATLTAKYLPIKDVIEEKGEPEVRPALLEAEIPATESVRTSQGHTSVSTPTTKVGFQGDSYYDENGQKVTDKWIYDEQHQKWYYFKKDGTSAKKTWKDDYYLKNDGTMAASEWVYDENYGSWYYLKEDGKYARNEWFYYKDGWYYLNETGAMEKGWLEVSTKWYYLDQDGKMEIGWVQVENKWYYLNKSGALLTNTTTPDGYKVNRDGVWVK